MRNAEACPLDFSVTAVDEEALVLDELLQFGHVDDTAPGFGAVVHAGERDRLETVVREEGESVPRGPVPGHLRQRRVPRVTGVQAFTENVFQLRCQGINVADARRA